MPSASSYSGTALYYGYIGYGLFAQRWVDPDEVASSVRELLDEGWHASLGQGLAAAKAENKLILVDMWATWCKNCLTMDRTTLKAPEVEAGLESYVRVKFQAEDLDASPARRGAEARRRHRVADLRHSAPAAGRPDRRCRRLVSSP